MKHDGCYWGFHGRFGIPVVGSQGFVSAVENLREFVPAVYDTTVAISKELPDPTMIRIFRGQPSEV